MERLEFIEFRQQLLFDNDDVSRSIFEYGLNQRTVQKNHGSYARLQRMHGARRKLWSW